MNSVFHSGRVASLLFLGVGNLTACFSPTLSDVDPGSGTSSSSGGTDASTDGAATTRGNTTIGSSGGQDTGETMNGSSTVGETAETTGELDMVLPSVDGVLPVTGEYGVEADVEIRVTFSEPMDRVSTQAAWQSGSIGGVTFLWEDDDTVLRVVPNDDLAYATGDSINGLTPNEYSFTIDTTATDRAGNPLNEAFSSSFHTLRRIQSVADAIDGETGSRSEDCNSINVTDVWVGDTQSDFHQEGVISIALPVLENGGQLESAALYAEQTYCGGAPYGASGLGTVHIWEVDAFEGIFEPCTVAPVVDVGLLSADATYEMKSADVTEAVESDYANTNAKAQFFLLFTTQTDGDGVLDRCTFSKATISLEVVYLVE